MALPLLLCGHLLLAQLQALDGVSRETKKAKTMSDKPTTMSPEEFAEFINAKGEKEATLPEVVYPPAKPPRPPVTELEKQIVLNHLEGMNPTAAARAASEDAAERTPSALCRRAQKAIERVASQHEIMCKALDQHNVTADRIAGRLSELLNAKTVIKMRAEKGGDYLEEVEDNKSSLTAIDLAAKMRGLYAPKVTEHYEMSFEERLERIEIEYLERKDDGSDE